MHRNAVILCFVSFVISEMSFQRHMNSRASKRLASMPLDSGYLLDRSSNDPGMYAMVHDEITENNARLITEPFEFKSADKLGMDIPSYPDLSSLPEIITTKILPYTTNPLKLNSEYEISRARANAKYDYLSKFAPSDIKTDIMIENLKSDMHYAPPGPHTSDMFSSYEGSDFYNDDDDVRSSSRTMYDNYWPHIYHSPYEYEQKRSISNIEKAKDKRYVDQVLDVKPIHEHIEDDVPDPNQYSTVTPLSTDNPIEGNGPFFSFVLNDYFDKNPDEDTLSFKGINVDWGKEFDHESYRPSADDVINSRRDRHTKSSYYTQSVKWSTTTSSPNLLHLDHKVIVNDSPDIYKNTRYTEPTHTVIPYTSTHNLMPPNGYSPSLKISQDYTPSQITSHDYPSEKFTTSQRESATESSHKNIHDFDKFESGKDKHSDDNKSYRSDGHKYEGFRDFLDGFANKFGSEDHKKESDYMHKNNVDKGQNRKGFHRVYHKDEFQEDKEFYDNSNNAAKAHEKGSSKVHIGGSEALLRSQAAANVGNAANTSRKFGNMGDKKFENAHSGHDESNTKGNKFFKFIDVAKQAARSNGADYLDHYKV